MLHLTTPAVKYRAFQNVTGRQERHTPESFGTGLPQAQQGGGSHESQGWILQLWLLHCGSRKRGGRNAALLLGKDWGLPWLDFVLGKHKKQIHIGVVLCGILL